MPISQAAKDRISALLTAPTGKYLTAKEALQNKGIVGDSVELEAQDLGLTVTELKKF